MLTSILGLGGGGLRVALEYLEWLEALRAGRESQDAEGGGWIFNALLPQGAFESGFAFAMMDCVSGDLTMADSMTNRFEPGVVYSVAETEGFAGDYQKGLKHIETIQDRLRVPGGSTVGDPRRPYSTVDGGRSLIDFLHADLRLNLSDAVLACTSLVGGTGRATFEYLNKHWESCFPKEDGLKALVGVLPPMSEMVVPRLRNEVASYLGRLNSLLTNGDISCVFLTDYNVARSAFCAAGDFDTTQHVRDIRMRLGQAVDDRDTAAFEDAMSELGSLPEPGRQEGPYDSAVDGGVVLSTAPLLANAVGPLVASEPRPQIADPKLLDAKDLLRTLKGSFVVPCYIESRTPLGSSLAQQFAGYKPHYASLGVRPGILDDPTSFCLMVLADLAISLGSLVPLPLDRGRLGGFVKEAFFVAWGAESMGLALGQLEPISAFLRQAYGVGARAFSLAGSDLVRPYINARHGGPASDVVFRLWVYLGLRDDSAIQSNIEMLA